MLEARHDLALHRATDLSNLTVEVVGLPLLKNENWPPSIYNLFPATTATYSN